MFVPSEARGTGLSRWLRDSRVATRPRYATTVTFMWTWILILGGYAFSIFLFHILGGIGAASDAIQSWGRSAAQRAVERSGTSTSSYARSRLSRHR